jgi:hypothetical protein
MSACPKFPFAADDLPVELPPAAPPAADAPWWHGAVHLAALLSFLGLCALLSVVGLLWYSLAIEPG